VLDEIKVQRAQEFAAHFERVEVAELTFKFVFVGLVVQPVEVRDHAVVLEEFDVQVFLQDVRTDVDP